MIRWAVVLWAILAATGVAAAQDACSLPREDGSVARELASTMRAQPVRALARRADRDAVYAAAVRDGTVRTIDPKDWIDRQFIAFDPDYLASRASRRIRLDKLKARLDAAQKSGHWLYCSQQLYDEADWRIEYTALWREADRVLDALDASFAETSQARAAEQAPDGSFGGCRSNFIFRLDSTVSAFNAMPAGDTRALAHRLSFLDRLSDTNDLAHLLFSRATSAIGSTGVYAREEQAALNEALPQLLFKPALLARARANGALFLTPDYVARYRAMMDAMQDPVTGFWGPVLIGAERVFLPDLSMTYHIVAYRGGCVARWHAIWPALLAMRERDYPYGWRWQGRVTPHNGYDVVRLFHLGWPDANEDQRAEARAAIAAILREVLARDIAADGQVRFDPAYYETEAAAYYFAVALLDVAGYWRPDRFWTSDRAIAPDAPALCRALKRRVEALDGESSLAAGALTRLQRACP